MVIALLAAVLLQGQPPAQVSLDEAIRRGMAARGRITEAAAAVAEARAGRRFASQIPNPVISYQHTGDTPRQHVSFDQPFSWLVTRGADRAAASAGLRRAEADSILLTTGVVAEIRSAFYGALGSRAAERLAVEQVAVADSLAALARRRFEAGDISRYEWEQAAQEARRGQLLLSFARESTRARDAAFARAIGASEPVRPAASDPLDGGLDGGTGLALPLDSMPMVAAAVADSAALAFAARSAARARLPVPSLQGGADWDDPAVPGRRFSVLGFAVPLPLWNSGGAEAALARARADRGAAVARETRLEAAQAVAEARVRLDETARRARFARDSLAPAAKSLRERALIAYRLGETSILSVLDALRSEREVVQQQVESLTAFQSALAAWNALFGRME